MKNSLKIIALLLFFTSATQSQQLSAINDVAAKYHIGIKGKKISMPKFDKKTMIQEDSINEIYKVGGMRFAKKFDVSLTPENSGVLISRTDSSKIWKVDIASDSAYSINILFTKFHLIKGDTLYVYNADKSRIAGPLTEKDNLKSGKLPLAPIDGDVLTVELHQSAQKSTLRSLEIGEINHDYRGFRALPYPNSSTYSKDTCSQPASCVDAVKQVKQSVCLLIISGNILCSGTLINNTAQDGKPYLLTAAHCFNETTSYATAEAMAPSIVAFFNYEVPNCTPAIRGSIEFAIGGSTLKAFAADIDFALIELSSTPTADFRPYYAGWNLSTSPTAPFRCIHHPFGKVKMVTEEDNAISNATYSGLLADSHWRVAKWEVGTTQEGSSGSGLFDSSLRLVGALTGGSSVCTSPVNDYYYRLNKAWNTYTDTSKQLKAWLDPTSSNVTELNGLNPYGKDSTLRISNFASSDTPEKAYLSSSTSELAAGQNSLSVSEYAEKFSLTENARLYGVYLMPWVANATSSASNIVTVKVYAGDTSPQSLLTYKTLAIKNLEWIPSTSSFSSSSKTVFADNENYIRFDEPVAVGKNFFVSYEIPYTDLPANNFAMYTAVGRASGGTETAYANNNGWVKMFNLTSTRTSLWIDPVIRYDSSAIVSDTSVIERTSKTLVWPNPVVDILKVLPRKDKSGTWTLTLYESSGKTVRNTSRPIADEAIYLDATSLQRGVYILRVKYTDDTENYKIIKR